MKTKYLPLGMIFFLLSGCASQQSVDYEWKKSGASIREYSIANGECRSESYKAVPLTQNQETGCEFKTGFAKGFCTGSSARQGNEIILARKEIYDGCMMSKGWTSYAKDKS